LYFTTVIDDVLRGYFVDRQRILLCKLQIILLLNIHSVTDRGAAMTEHVDVCFQGCCWLLVLE